MTTETAPQALVGEQFGPDGRYTLLRLIGTGGMASVWLASDAVTGHDVAVKVLSDSLALDPQFVLRFEREARLAAGLSHPNVVPVLDHSSGGTRPYLVMEFIPGGTLAELVRESPLDRWDIADLARYLLATLAYLHGCGVLHRDLKPANVLVGTDGQPRLTDFGVAQLTDGTRMTATGELIGTQGYLAPEVLAGSGADARSDLFSCGVLLDECAGPDVPYPVAALIVRLTEPEPGRRPATATEALALLGDAPDALALLDDAPEITAATRRAAPSLDQPTAWMPPLPVAAPAVPVDVSPQYAQPQYAPQRLPAPFTAAAPVTYVPQRPRLRRRIALSVVAAVAVLGTVSGFALTAGAEDPAPAVPAPAPGPLAQQLDQLDEAIAAVTSGTDD